MFMSCSNGQHAHEGPWTREWRCEGAPAGALIVVGAAYGDVREIDELGLVKIPPELLFRLSKEDCAWLTVAAVETKAAIARN
jgi:hypothetical protein